MSTEPKTHRDPFALLIDQYAPAMPDGFDTFGIKSVHPDMLTTRGFHWAFPGGDNVSNDALDVTNRDACPVISGDGLCVATSWRGMSSGGIAARTLLLVAYRAADIVGRDDHEGKLRIGGVVRSIDLIDGERFIREHGHGTDLYGANLYGANLYRANLRGADLRGADLYGADLRGADLYGTDLYGANLYRANLRGADLRGADLYRANLSGAIGYEEATR